MRRFFVRGRAKRRIRRYDRARFYDNSGNKPSERKAVGSNAPCIRRNQQLYGALKKENNQSFQSGWSKRVLRIKGRPFLTEESKFGERDLTFHDAMARTRPMRMRSTLPQRRR